MRPLLALTFERMTDETILAHGDGFPICGEPEEMRDADAEVMIADRVASGWQKWEERRAASGKLMAITLLEPSVERAALADAEREGRAHGKQFRRRELAFDHAWGIPIDGEMDRAWIEAHTQTHAF